MWSDPTRDPVSGLTPLMVEFLDWLAKPDGRSQNKWAADHDVSSSKVSKWRTSDPHFQAALSKRIVEDHLDPTGMAAAIEALKKKAEGGDAQAFNALMAYMKWLDPKPQDVSDRPLSEYSDAELRALADELVAQAADTSGDS